MMSSVNLGGHIKNADFAFKSFFYFEFKIHFSNDAIFNFYIKLPAIKVYHSRDVSRSIYC